MKQPKRIYPTQEERERSHYNQLKYGSGTLVTKEKEAHRTVKPNKATDRKPTKTK